MIYLDNSATTELASEVRESMEPYLSAEFGNASSVYTLGNRARVALEESREVIARHIGAEPREIIFTSSGTEANNAAIKGPLFTRFFQGTPWSAMTVLTSPAEHHAVLHPSEFLEKLGVKVHRVTVDSTGHVVRASLDSQQLDSQQLDSLQLDSLQLDSQQPVSQQPVSLASFMLVNNEVGAINPISELAASVRTSSPEALIHTDAVQALGKMPIDVKSLGVDLLSLSAHKIHGPKGIGVLYVRSGVEWEPLLHGGAQERNRRGGTESVAMAVGFAEAVRQIEKHPEALEHFRDLRQYLLQSLGMLPYIVLNSATDASSIDTIVNFSFTPEILAKLDADALLIRFDLDGIAISNGSACTSGSLQPSHVLLAMGKGAEVASRSLRVSFARTTTREDLDQVIMTLRRIVE